MTTMGSVKPLSQPPTPLRLMEQPQHRKLVISAQVKVVDKSAVDERKIPVMPIKEPQIELRNSAPM